MAITFSDKKVLILGAGVTGVAVARSLTKRGAQVWLADDIVTEVAGLAPPNLMHLLSHPVGSQTIS